MYNNTMDLESIRIVQEKISRKSPAELARIQQQMMSDLDLMTAEIGGKMANATPEEIAAMLALADAQVKYELNAAEMLKKQGNELHSQGKFCDAMENYLLAKHKIKEIPFSQSRKLLLACSLNLMSCYLKTRQYDECIEEGSEVLAYDAKNLKAFYRRGQAYKELGLLKEAVADLSMVCEVYPDDDNIAGLLRDTKEMLTKEGGEHAPGRMSKKKKKKKKHTPRRLVSEEITEELENVSSGSFGSSSVEQTVAQPKKFNDSSNSCSTVNKGKSKTNVESLDTLKNDPEPIRSFQNFISNADPTILASSNAGQSRDVSPDMIRTALNMISKVSPGELQRMLDMDSSFQGDNPFLRGSPDSTFDPGSIPPNVTPEMFETATDMISKMQPDDLQKMFEMASSLKGKESISSSPAVDKNVRNASHSDIPSSADGSNALGESSSSDDSFSNMFTSMIENMSPEMMANIDEQFDFKLSKEDAAKAQQALSSLLPEDLDKMMRWADRIQRVVEGAKKTKNWLLGKPGMILAIFMLILAIILHHY